MNKKGQVSAGVIITLAMALIIGAVFLVATAQNVGEVTNTYAVENVSLSMTNATAYYLTGYRALEDVVIYNESSGGGDPIIIHEDNYTVANNVVYNGALAVTITPGVNANDYLPTWNVSGTAQPLTYDSNGGGRAIAALIVVLFAVALVVIAVEPTMRSKIFG